MGFVWKCIFGVVCEVRYGDERYSMQEQQGWLLGLLIKLLSFEAR
jgi:hypothetical protein